MYFSRLAKSGIVAVGFLLELICKRGQATRQMLRQLDLWNEIQEANPSPGPSAVTETQHEFQQSAHALLNNQSTYASIKRVSLVYEGSLSGRLCLTSTDESKAFFKQYWKDNPGNDQERFVVACLDTKHRVQSVVAVTVGTLDATLIHPREVFKPAIVEGSSGVVLSHNHPSGDPTPSREDREVTDRLTKAGEILGITVLDHIIHADGRNDVISLRET